MTHWEKIMVNLKVVKFLLANQAALLQVVAIAKGWRKDLPYVEQWALVDSIARVLIPILEAQAVAPKALTTHRFHDADFEDTDYEALAFEAGAEVAALSVDWKLMVEVILPIVISILKALSCGKEP
jgi:hypothetical protein